MSTSSKTVELGIVQMRCEEDAARNLTRALADDPRGRRPRRAPRLPAGALPLALLLPDRGQRALRPGRADSRADHRGLLRRWPRSSDREHRRQRVRAARARALPQHRARGGRRRRRRRASTARCTSPTIRATTRSSTSRRATWASRPSTPPRAGSGTLICWDQWYPGGGAPDRAHGRRDPVLPDRHRLAPGGARRRWASSQHDAWETIQRSHAIANGCFVAAVNRTGFEPDPSSDGTGIEFWGQSFVAAPDGSVLAKAPADEEADPQRHPGPRPHRGRSAATGPSCATGASTPTARSAGASSTEKRCHTSTLPWAPVGAGSARETNDRAA